MECGREAESLRKIEFVLPCRILAARGPDGLDPPSPLDPGMDGCDRQPWKCCCASHSLQVLASIF